MAVEEAAVPVEESFRTLLDRMASMTNGLFPALTDLAREARYRYFDHPLPDKINSELDGHTTDTLVARVVDECLR